MRSTVTWLLLTVLTILIGCGSEPRSPAPAPDWTVIGPGGGGSTFLPTFSPVDPDTMLLRCDMSGGYLTRDGGQSWKLLNFPGGAQTFALDPSDLDRMYVGAGGLHGSSDGGQTWDMLFPNPDAVTEIHHTGDHASLDYVTTDNYPDGRGSSVRAIWVDPDDSNHLVIALGAFSESGGVSLVFDSRDGGKSFQAREELAGPLLRLLYVNQPEPTLLAFTRSSLYRLSPATPGKVAEEKLPAEVTPAGWVDAGTNPEDGSTILWLTSIGAGRFAASGQVFVSVDLGKSWQKTGPPLESSTKIRSFSHVAASASDGRVAYLACDRSIETNPDGDQGLSYGVLKTTDLGKTWEWVYRAGGGSPDYTVRDGKMADNVDDSWAREAFAGEYIRVLHTSVSPTDPEIAVFTDWYRAMKTSDGGKHWQALYSENLPDGSVRSRGFDVTTAYGVHFDPFDPDHLVISYTDIGFFHSHDRGKTWRRSVEGVPPRWDNTVYWVQFDPEVKDRIWSVWSSWHDIPRMKMIRNPNWKKSAVGGVCVSNDGGKSWTVSSGGLPETSPTTFIVMEPASSADGRTLYVAVYGQGVFKSVDGGKNWERKNAGLSANLNAWEITRSPEGTLYLVVAYDTRFAGGKLLRELTDGELYRSRDGAESWERVPLPAGVRFPNSVTVDEKSPGRLYLSSWQSITGDDLETKGGVFVTDDDGRSWKSIFDPTAFVYGLAIDYRHPGRLFLNTFQNAAWRSDDSGENWKKIAGYDFRWGHRPVIDPHDPEKIYLTTFGGSVMHGTPRTEE